MKIVYIECNEDELKANRGLMDSIVDAVHGVLDSFYGTYNPPTNFDPDESDEGEGAEESEE